MSFFGYRSCRCVGYISLALRFVLRVLNKALERQPIWYEHAVRTNDNLRVNTMFCSAVDNLVGSAAFVFISRARMPSASEGLLWSVDICAHSSWPWILPTRQFIASPKTRLSASTFCPETIKLLFNLTLRSDDRCCTQSSRQTVSVSMAFPAF